MKKKICHLIFSFNSGGAENMLIDIIQEQIKYVEVDLIVVNNNYNDDLLLELDKSVTVSKINRKSGKLSVGKILRLNLLLLSKKYHVIHCHQHNLIGMLFPNFRKKSVLTIHDTKIQSKYFSKYAKLFAISESVKKDVEERYGLTATIVYNGIKINEVRERKQPFDFKKGLKILQIGRLTHKKKGQHIAIEGINDLKEKYNLSLDFIGDGESEPFLRELVEKFDLLDIIHFLGLKKKSWIYENIYKYDLVIMPSLNEGFGLTVVEGIAAKIPVLVSNIEGPMEIINHGEFGFYFETNSIADFKAEIEKIIQFDMSSLTSKTVKAYNYCKNNFDVKITAMNYLKNY